MTDPVTSTSTANQVSGAAFTEAPPPSISSDFETFLKMMTAQLENQDPLNPLESSDFAVQLATFSGVEQQVRTNDLLGTMQSQMSISDLSNMAAFVGMEARVAAPANFSGAPIDVAFALPRIADTGVLVVSNESGSEVARISVQPGETTASWNGLNDSGAAVPWGNYSFDLEVYDDDELIETTAAEVYSPVLETRLEGGETHLIFSGGISVPATNVTGIRQPQ